MLSKILNAFKKTEKDNHYDVIFHIGAPKCGSSAIQRLCLENRGFLEKNGYYYPEHPIDKNGVSGGHTQLSIHLVKNEQRHAADFFQKSLEEAQRRKACLLISAEALFDQHQAIFKFTEGLKVQVIAFVRNPVEALIANHNQGIKRHMRTHRLSEMLPGFFTRTAKNLAALPLLDWANHYGDEHCVFLPYVSPRDGGEPVDKLFSDILGLDVNQISRAKKNHGLTNSSYVKSALELKRVLNTVLADIPADDARRVDHCLQSYSDQNLYEKGFAIGDIPTETFQKIRENLLDQMQPVIDRFPDLRKLAEVEVSKAEKQVHLCDIYKPFASLQEECPDVTNKIIKKAKEYRDQGRYDYTFLKLLDLLEIDFKEPSVDGLSCRQKEIIEGEKNNSVVVLKELAICLDSHGNKKDALFLINLAVDLKPGDKNIGNIKKNIIGN